MKITLTDMSDLNRQRLEQILENAGIGQPCGEEFENVTIEVPGSWTIYDFANECKMSGVCFSVMGGVVYAHDCDMPGLLLQQAC